MKIKGSCYLRRLFWVISLGFIIWLIFIAEVSQAMMPLQNQHRKKALQEIYETYKKNFPEVPEVTPAEAMKLLQTGQAVFVDVRPLAECRVSKLPESRFRARIFKLSGQLSGENRHRLRYRRPAQRFICRKI